MLKGVVLGFLCFLLFLILHVIIFHKRNIASRFNALVRIFLLLLPVYIVLYRIIAGDAIIFALFELKAISATVIGLSAGFNFCMGILVYLLLFFGYCQFYFIVDRSISVRVMIEIEKNKNKCLSLEEIENIYSQDYIFSRRLGHMVDNHYVTEENGYYKNTARGRIYAGIMEFIKKYLNLGKGG